jgi:beta-lactamase class C
MMKLNRLFALPASGCLLALLTRPMLALGVMAVAAQLQAQQPKQITYEVKVPVTQAATSSAPARVLSAPAPVIRPVEEAAAIPSRPKTAAKVTKAPGGAGAQSTQRTAKATKSTAKAAAKKPATDKANTAKPAATKAGSAQQPARASAPKPTLTKAANPPKAQAAASDKPSTAILAVASPTQAAVRTSVQTAPASLAVRHAEAATGTAAPALATTGAGALVGAAALASLEVDGEELDNADLGEQEELDSAPLAPETTPEAMLDNRPALIPKAAAQPLQVSAARERFVSEFQRIVEKKLVPNAPGVALAIVADGRVRVLETYGVKRARGSDPVNTDTLFRLASVSKSFGATAAALLVRDGLVSWDSSVTSLLPQVQFSNPRYSDQVTVRNIMSQSTGLPTQANSNFIEEGQSFDEVVRRLRNVSFICPPGKCYNYQNVTYSLIAPIIQKKTGKTYEQYVTERIFNPLGMNTANFGVTGFKATNNYASPHVGTRKGWAATEVNENYYRFGPAAGINASINDMARWLLAQLGHYPEVLPPMVLNTVQSKVTRNTPAQNHYGSREGVTDSHYGLGWRVFDYRGDKNFVHHGGGVQGFRSEMVFNRELQIGMVVLTNTGRLAGDIIFDFLDAYEDEKRGERKSAVSRATPKKPAVKKPVKKKEK